MPRLPVDGTKVIEHRITFGTLERDQISELVNAIQAQKYTQAIENVANPIVDVLKDASALYAIVTLIEVYTDIDLPILTVADLSVQEIMNEIKTGIETRRELYPDEPPSGSLAMVVKDMLISWFGGRSDLGGQEFNAPPPPPWGGGIPGGGAGGRPVYTGQTPPI